MRKHPARWPRAAPVIFSRLLSRNELGLWRSAAPLAGDLHACLLPQLPAAVATRARPATAGQHGCRSGMNALAGASSISRNAATATTPRMLTLGRHPTVSLLLCLHGPWASDSKILYYRDVFKIRDVKFKKCVMSRLIHIAHVLHSPPPPTRTAL